MDDSQASRGKPTQAMKLAIGRAINENACDLAHRATIEIVSGSKLGIDAPKKLTAGRRFQTPLSTTHQNGCAVRKKFGRKL